MNMTFRETLIANCRAKAKPLGRLLTSMEVVELASELHEACLPQSKAPRASTSIATGAEQVYQLYPLKVGRDAALRAISVQLKKHELSYLLDKTNQFAEAVKSWPSSYRYLADGGDRCPHGSTWFNQGRFADDISLWKRRGARTGAPHQYVPPSEPDGWRNAFPDFTERDKPWNQLQPAQHVYIITHLAAQSSTQIPNEVKSESSLRTA